jgi:hypothetical protein
MNMGPPTCFGLGGLVAFLAFSSPFGCTPAGPRADVVPACWCPQGSTPVGPAVQSAGGGRSEATLCGRIRAGESPLFFGLDDDTGGVGVDVVGGHTRFKVGRRFGDPLSPTGFVDLRGWLTRNVPDCAPPLCNGSCAVVRGELRGGSDPNLVADDVIVIP